MRQDTKKLIEMFEYNFKYRDGVDRAEAEQMIIYLLGQDEAKKYINVWSEELEQEYQNQE